MTARIEPTTVAITGTGFIGTRLAARLAARGHDIVGIDLDDRARPTWEALGGRVVTGDVTDPEAMARACVGRELVVHTAAVVAESGDWDHFEAVNVAGARTVAQAARAAGAQRFVHLSSVMVHGFDYPDDITEDGPLDPADNPYCATKIRSESAVLELHDPGVFDVWVLRPGDVYGPGSVPWVLRPLAAMQAGLWATIDPGAGPPPLLNHVYVDNLLDGLELMLVAGAAGEPYTVTDGARTTTEDYFAHLAAMVGVSPPRITPADAVAFGVDPEAVRYLLRRGRYSNAKISALGFAPAVDLASGMARTRAWLEAEGYLEP